jgi:hypothetical protein
MQEDLQMLGNEYTYAVRSLPFKTSTPTDHLAD